MNSPWKRLASGFLLGALALATAGAGVALARSNQKAPSPRDATRYQAWLEKEVRHELVLLPLYSVFDNLEFKVDGDRVTLLGQVVHSSIKSDAEARVKRIEGVTAVDNQIEVLPLSGMDDRLRRALYRAIYSDPGMEKYAIQAVPPIHIIVKNGQVTLEGVVDSEADKNVTNIRARGVPGSFSVTNHLRVEK
jgi:hyperosmotically inducible protein